MTDVGLREKQSQNDFWSSVFSEGVIIGLAVLSAYYFSFFNLEGIRKYYQIPRSYLTIELVPILQYLPMLFIIVSFLTVNISNSVVIWMHMKATKTQDTKGNRALGMIVMIIIFVPILYFFSPSYWDFGFMLYVTVAMFVVALLFKISRLGILYYEYMDSTSSGMFKVIVPLFLYLVILFTILGPLAKGVTLIKLRNEANHYVLTYPGGVAILVSKTGDHAVCVDYNPATNQLLPDIRLIPLDTEFSVKLVSTGKLEQATIQEKVKDVEDDSNYGGVMKKAWLWEK